jgi:hypothetical protein
MSTPKVYADFHNLDEADRLRLTCAGTREDLARLGIELREGLVLTFYMDDADDHGQPDELLIEGTVHQRGQVWVASVDWATVRHASDARGTGNGAPTATSALPDPRPQE